MAIVLIGLNHNTAPVELREKLYIQKPYLGDALKRILSVKEISEGVILSTCNRTEIYIVTAEREEALIGLKDFLYSFSGIASHELEGHLYSYSERKAIEHLFRVASSLDSMIIGEPQILGQVKEAYSLATQNNATGMVLNKLFHRAFSVAKMVRTDTKIANNAVSISFAAVELAKKIFDNLRDKKCMLIGSGEMAELAAKHLITNGVGEIWITNRTYERALNLAQTFQAQAVPFDELYQNLMHVDIVISSTGAEHPLITKKDLSPIIRERKYRPMFFIDIAVPRDVDPEVNRIDNVYLYDIDDLQSVAEANLRERRKEALVAEEMIRKEAQEFYSWLNSLNVVPIIVSLKKKMEEIGKKELEKTLSHLKGATEAERKALELLTSSIINKILHEPITTLKKEVQTHSGGIYLEITKKLFHLED